MRALKALVAASAVLLFLGLEASTIWDANEAFYTETPRQMVQSGDYVNPTFNGAPRFNKPVLSYWIVAGFYKVFGVSVWVERVAIALGALGIAAAAFVIARLGWSMRAAWIAALVILSSPRVVFFARRIFIDVWITLFMSLVLMFFALAEARPKQRRRYLLLMYAAAGCGVLTKGPIAIVLPALAFFVYLVWHGRLRELRRMYLVTGALIVMAIVTPWYAMVYAEHGWGYIREFFIGENLGRYAETVGQQSRPSYFYLPVLFSELFPWSLFLPAALWAAWRRANPEPLMCGTPMHMEMLENDGFLPARAPRLSRLLLVWIGVIVVAFTFSSTKQDLYIFPIVAAIAVLIAATLDRAVEGVELEYRAVRWTLPVIVVLLFLFELVLHRLFGTVGSRYFIQGAQTASHALAIGAFALMVCIGRGAMRAAVLALGLTFVVVNYVLVLVSIPDFERFKPVAPLSAAALARNSAAPVVQYRVALPSMVWYLGKPVEEILDLPVLQDRFSRDGETLVLLKASDYPEVQPLAPTCVVARGPLMDVKPREILAGTALPEMLLISNKCQ